MPKEYTIAKNLVDRNFRNIDQSLLDSVESISEEYCRFTITMKDGSKIEVAYNL